MRFSLTRRQLESSAAAALLALLEDVTADGQITDDEVKKLHVWMLANDQTDLPSIAYFRVLLDEILADGKITPDERRSIFIAAERAMPPDRREIARARRIAVEAAAKLRVKNDKLEEQQRSREARERNRPTGYFDFMVAGVKYDGRGRTIRKHLKIGDVVYLVRDPGNRYDSNATAIRLANGMDIGYVPREHAVDLAPMLDAGHKQKSYCKKLVGQLPIPVVLAQIYRPETTIDGAIESSLIPHQVQGPKPGCLGCGGSVICIVAVLLISIATLFR